MADDSKSLESELDNRATDEFTEKGADPDVAEAAV